MGLKQQAENLFFGSGVQEVYAHWQSQIPGHGSLFTPYGTWEAGEAPDLWAYRITATNPLDTERLLPRVITYSVLYTVAEMLNEEKGDDTKPFYKATPDTGRACAAWVFNDNLDEFDLHTLDEVLQVAVYGGIWHPHFTPRDRS